MKKNIQINLITALLIIKLVHGLKKEETVENSSEEDEMDDIILGRKMNTHEDRATNYNISQEAIVEKFIESLMSSEKYLSLMEKKLTHLDVTLHEKSNSIIKYLNEMMRKVQPRPNAAMEAALTGVKNDLDKFKKNILDKVTSLPTMRRDGSSYHISDIALNSKLANLEHNTKATLEGIENIITTMTEVKNRQYGKMRMRPDAFGNLDAINLVTEIRRTMHDQRLKKCDCNKNGRVDRSERYPTDCNEIQMQGFNISGIYKIKPDEYDSFYVLCDLITAGGGWTVIQNRFDGSQNFLKNWYEYKYGFGNLAGEFWMGLDKLHYLTTQKLYELRIEMETSLGHDAYAGYSVFSIGPEVEGYRMSTLGTYYGTAGDSLSYHAGQKFSTIDVDNDEWKDGSCANEHGGAWWYKECDKSNLNGNYILDGNDEAKGKSMYWISFKGTSTPLGKTRMMIRPLPASRPIETSDVSRKIVETSSGPMHGASKLKSDTKKTLHQHYRYDDALQSDPYFK